MQRLLQPPFSIRTILGLMIGLMGLLGLLSTLVAGNINRNLAVENHRSALVELVRLKTTDHLRLLEEHARDLGVAIQNEAEFRARFNAGDRAGMERALTEQFHQYFVTAGVLQLQKMIVFDQHYRPLAAAQADGARPLTEVRVCPDLLKKARLRVGPKRARVLTDICRVDGEPYQTMLVGVGGLVPRGYLAVVVDPIPMLMNIQAALGMPVKVAYSGNKDAFKSSNWPPSDAMEDTMVAEYPVRGGDGTEVLTVSILADQSSLYAKLRHARTLLLMVVALMTLIFISIALWVFRMTTVKPLRNLTSQLRLVGRDRTNLLGVIGSRGVTEIQELAINFNQMAAELGDLYATLENMAFHDSLTGLPNRNRFHERLTGLVASRSGETRPFAVLLMDLDRFKAVNDTLGHHIGDELLREFGRRFQQVFAVPDFAGQASTAGCVIARIGGDEFAALVPEIGSTDHAIGIAQALLRVLDEPCVIGGYKLALCSSIGIALYPQHGIDPNTLMRRADLAMYHAKSTRRGYALYQSSLDAHTLHQLTLESDLNRAIDTDELFLEYQPQIDLCSGHVCGVEALVRWMHPDKGLIWPADFIPLVEQTGIVQRLTGWVLDRALRDCAEWQREGYGFGVSVNLSPVNLHHPSILKDVSSALGKWHINSRDLTLELTENAVMTDPEHAIRVLGILVSTGINVSIDDFGTGHCSLSYIKKLPVNEIKIDRSFIMEMNGDQNDLTIVRSTIGLAHNMNLKVIAEGVEDATTLGRLRELGCDKAQGYHISRPLPMNALVNWLGERRDVACSTAYYGPRIATDAIVTSKR